MSDFQVTIVGGEAVKKGEKSEFEVEQQGRGGRAVLSRIEDLENVWDDVVRKLTGLAEKSHAALTEEYELKDIQFNIGIEAGLNVGLVTKGNASVSITFSRKDLGKG
mgnify:FL=1|jgi:hypothetical protein|tara:strand:- start:223 stop:543 length:321 start_codon:yes stop_codon:yes gene_type:complete